MRAVSIALALVALGGCQTTDSSLTPPGARRALTADQPGACADTSRRLVGADGPSGPSGPPGPSGAVGPLPGVQAGGGLMGTGASGDPITVDPQLITSKREAGHHIELESQVQGALVSAVARASGGEAAVWPASIAPGTLWTRTGSAGSGLLAAAPSLVTARVQVANASSGMTVVTLECRRSTSGGDVVESVAVVPNTLAANTWAPRQIQCDFDPSDLAQSVSLVGFASGLTDLSVDFVSITPRVETGKMRLQKISAVPADGSGDQACAALDGLCLSTTIWVDVHDTTDGTCGNVVNGFYHDDCAHSLDLGSPCHTTCLPNPRGVCTDVQTRAGENGTHSAVLCLVPDV